jgi:polysaccharide biosynthesis/export protein
VAEETPVAWENAQEPQPGDIVVTKEDYALRPGDVVRVSIFELFLEGVALVNDYIVSETGKISIPEVGVIQAAGLTERQVEQEVKRILTPNVLREPSVTATLLDSQQRTFSILGNAVARPSRYLIPRYDFRLTDALATAGTQMQFNVSTIYVSRRGEAAVDPVGTLAAKAAPGLNRIEPASSSRPPGGASTPSWPAGLGPLKRQIREPSEPAQRFETEREMLDLIAPQARYPWPRSEKVSAGPPAGGGRGVPNSEYRVGEHRNDITASILPGGFHVQTPVEFGGATAPARTQELASQKPPAKPQERTEWIFRDGRWVPVIITSEGSRLGRTAGASQGSAPQSAGNGGMDWTFRDGRWTPVLQGSPQAAPTAAKPEFMGPSRPSAGEKLPPELEWEQAIQTRLIRIPADKLLAGDPRYNIIIKPGDTIHVPVDIIGEFAIMGNVNRSGYIDITGRPMTLKMAIAAAGGLGPLAWPKKVEVVRRIGTAREEIVLVDLDKIASGEQPDFFIKPNDLINVGTHATARWRAVLRNAFRATYGFGFVYDRNFADIDFGTGFPFFTNF